MADEKPTGRLGLARFRSDLGALPAALGSLALFSVLDSTNAFARRVARLYLADELTPPRTVVLALEQTAGRGRLGRRWRSGAGDGVWVTLLRAAAEGEEMPLVPLLVGVGLCGAVNRWLGGRCRLKWPNDLVVGGRKLGGILVETVAGDARPVLAVGFGVNLHPPGVAGGSATGVASETATPPSLGELAAALLAGVARELSHAREPAYAIAAYERCTVHRVGEPLRCRTAQGVVEGAFLGFDARGLLRLDDGSGERLLAAGDLEGAPPPPAEPA